MGVKRKRGPPGRPGQIPPWVGLVCGACLARGPLTMNEGVRRCPALAFTSVRGTKRHNPIPWMGYRAG